VDKKSVEIDFCLTKAGTNYKTYRLSFSPGSPMLSRLP
jgi:hypothetical protein